MAENETRIELMIPSPGKLFTPAVTVILALMIVGFALIYHAREFTTNYLAISATGVLSGKIWQLVTYPFVDPNGMFLIFDCFLVLFLGSNIEKEWRTIGLVLLWLTVSVVCGIIWVLICWLSGRNYIGFGASSCGYGLIATFGLIFRRKRFIAWFWVLEARHVAWGLIGIGLIFCIPQPVALIWVSGALVAYLYVKLKHARLMNIAPAIQKRPHGFVDID